MERRKDGERERERDNKKSEPQPPFDPSVGSLCHPCITTTKLSYRFPIFETSSTALRGPTGIHMNHMKANSKPALSSFSSASEMSNNPIAVSLDVNTVSYMSAHLIRGVLTSFSMVPQASPLDALGDPAVFSLVGYTISSYTNQDLILHIIASYYLNYLSCLSGILFLNPRIPV